MQTRIIHFTLPALLACATALLPAPAFADRDNGVKQHNRQQHEQRVERQETRRQDARTQHAGQPVGQPVGQRAGQRTSQFEGRHDGPHAGAYRPSVVRLAENRHIERRETHYNVRRLPVHQPVRIERPYESYRSTWRPVPRYRHYRGVNVYRQYGHRYPGFGFYYRDADAYPWLAFTALTLAVFDHLGEQQQRLHEQAFIRATTADTGDTIYWEDNHSSGSITVTGIWYDARGRQCRDLEQKVSSRNRTDINRNTVCEGRNGRWVVDNRAMH